MPDVFIPDRRTFTAENIPMPSCADCIAGNHNGCTIVARCRCAAHDHGPRCQEYLCPVDPVWVVTHAATFITVADDDAGKESVAAGFPTNEAKIERARTQRVDVALACRFHVERQRHLAELQLDDIAVERWPREGGADGTADS